MVLTPESSVELLTEVLLQDVGKSNVVEVPGKHCSISSRDWALLWGGTAPRMLCDLSGCTKLKWNNPGDKNALADTGVAKPG